MHLSVGTSYSLSLWAFLCPFSGSTCLIGVHSASSGPFLPIFAGFCPILAPVHICPPVLRTSSVRLSGRSGEMLSSFRLARVRQLVGLVDRDAVAIAQHQEIHGSGLW